jgi:hypothetical protein
MDMVRLDHPDKLEGGFKLKQALTFEEVCSVWSEKLRRGLDLQEKYILVRDSKYCLVGEAWGFSGRHVGYYIAPPDFSSWVLELPKIWKEVW